MRFWVPVDVQTSLGTITVTRWYTRRLWLRLMVAKGLIWLACRVAGCTRTEEIKS